MDKQKLYTILYVVLILTVITTCIVLTLWLKSESAVCLNDPINYYANKTNMICFCNNQIG